jgi:hypothetical protein
MSGQVIPSQHDEYNDYGDYEDYEEAVMIIVSMGTPKERLYNED